MILDGPASDDDDFGADRYRDTDPEWYAYDGVEEAELEWLRLEREE